MKRFLAIALIFGLIGMVPKHAHAGRGTHITFGTITGVIGLGFSAAAASAIRTNGNSEKSQQGPLVVGAIVFLGGSITLFVTAPSSEDSLRNKIKNKLEKKLNREQIEKEEYEKLKEKYEKKEEPNSFLRIESDKATFDLIKIQFNPIIAKVNVDLVTVRF